MKAWPLAVFLLAAAAAGAAQARTASLAIERATLPLGTVEGIAVRIAADGALELRAKSLDAAPLGYRFRDLRWTCALQRPEAGGFACKGAVRARGAGNATLAAQWKDGDLDLAISKGEGELGLAIAAPMTLRGLRVPAAWLQPLLAARWPGGTLTAGSVDARLAFGATPAGGVALGGPLSVSALGLDSRDGRIAAASLDARGRLDLAFDDAATGIALAWQVRGGELLAGPMYAALPESPIDLALALRSRGDGAWTLQRLAWKDPGVLDIEAGGVIDVEAAEASPAATADATALPLVALDAKVDLPSLAQATPRYFEALFGTLGLKELALEGAATLALVREAGAWRSVRVALAPANVREARFALEGLAGDFAWSSGAAVESTLRWEAARLHEIALGAATLPLRSEDGGVALARPVEVALLGGRLSIPRFAWKDGAFDGGLALRDVDLRQASQALGWPAFTGTASGDLPALRYADQALVFDGGLRLDLFDGRIEVADLSLERPFGVAPTLAARVAIEDLALEPLTGVFGFGAITGRLDGRIDGLRLVDWQPVAFDADLHTDAAAKGPRRISQRAVQDLSSVGGAGVVAGLQATVLKVFETFPYARIGLKCRLANNVCEMAGLDSSKGGYTIVEGSGLPRITVVGHQRRVDWPVLVARLKAATEGQVPIVE